MNQQKEHKIKIKISDVEVFELPVKENEESFYSYVVEQINNNVNRFRYGANSDIPAVALAKVTLYYATMLYRQTNLINSQTEMLNNFEERIDALLKAIE
ncbi:MAG: hypothetical protein J1F05_03820 [Muribaculaceae bacterium]|nr:hypothetical protein [Muribaculaceae bacterium]